MDRLTETPRATLTVTADPDRSALVVGLAGELDIASLPDVAPQLDTLLAREAQPVHLDLAGLQFMDSSGVTVLIRIANHFDPVTAGNASPVVARVVQVLGLADRFGLDGA
ncbi:STAS domain-containing protein [Modestobacter sp. I12A-02662]|uniref:STAS domain-containing protein n=1 Tax=Modestobacter sp. I12A-02662 TaxID=1730496 RepID=UPI0034DFA236